MGDQKPVRQFCFRCGTFLETEYERIVSRRKKRYYCKPCMEKEKKDVYGKKGGKD